MKVVSKYFMIFVALLGLGVLTGCDWVKDGENRPSSVQTDGTTGQVSIVSEIEKNIETLVLTVEATTLNKDANSSVSVKAVMKDGSTQELTDGLEWEIMPKYAVTVAKGILIAREDVPVKIKAKIGSVESNSVDLNITWTMNGYVLPPEPDKALNDSTLLGVDINDNGVRDDVERYIYETYKDKHPIHIDIAMQAGRAYEKVLETPERAKEIMNFVEAPLYCELYYRSCIDDINNNEKRLIHEDEEVDSQYFREVMYFNTNQRMSKYLEYDRQFSGDSYMLIRCSKRKELCDFNTSKYDD